MMILDAKISRVTRDRDFGMIEARVTLLAKTQTGQPARPITVLTHAPARAADLRARLIADATHLAGYLTLRPQVGAVSRAA